MAPAIDFPFGLAGLLAILCGWLYESAVAIRSRKSPMPAPFALLYGFGSLMLSIYSWSLGDVVFMALNMAATLMCSGVTAYGALKRLVERPRQRNLLLIGLGGVGMMGLSFAQELFKRTVR